VEMLTRSVSKAAIDIVAGAITHHDASARIERRENQFARLTRRKNGAGRGINDLHDAKVGIKMVTATRLVGRERAFGPGEFGFGKTIRGDDVQVTPAQLA